MPKVSFDKENITHSFKQAFTAAMKHNDIVVTTEDGRNRFIKQVLVEDFGATIHFERINIKSGKPTTLGTCSFEGKQKIIFGLPGNPVLT